MEIADIIEVNDLFKDLYPYVARQIAREYGRQRGLAIEVGPYGPGISVELAKLLPELDIVVGDDRAETNQYMREVVAESSVSDRIDVRTLDKFSLPFPDGSVDLVVCRGALFFWQKVPEMLREFHRVVRPAGLVMAGGGFGADTPDELIEGILERSRELNRRLSKKVLSDAEIEAILEFAGLKERTVIDRRHGIWLVIRKG
ncbi:MAG: class I SAM-dependent methyltransferase [Chloroflexi bacterium]|nr:class I SAM-dependent methyltransferase [Chloroflexota bacterium]